MVTSIMDYQKIIDRVYEEVKLFDDPGTVASYIPELAKVSPAKFGVHLSTLDGKHYGAGNFNEKFSIQSVAKVLSLTMAYRIKGVELWERVGVEPSGTAFNSLVQLEVEQGIPRNPLINAGAIVICDILVSELQNPKEELLAFVQYVSQNPNIQIDDKVFQSEKNAGYRNRALINLMKSFGNIHNDVDAVLDLYFSLCSIEMSCAELSRTFLFLANDGFDPNSEQQILTLSRSKRINAIMMTCGFYDEAGEFTFKVGLPGKSGIGGGIVAVYPEHFSIAVWSPKLNPKWNSFKGMKFLEEFTTETGQSVF
jgi:glutaminase